MSPIVIVYGLHPVSSNSYLLVNSFGPPADIFILASDSGEGLSQSLMQALVMETAVISTNVGSTKDLLFDGNFVMIDVNNQKQMDDACNELVNSSNLRQKYQNKSREYVMQNFSDEKMVEKITEVYDALFRK